MAAKSKLLQAAFGQLAFFTMKGDSMDEHTITEQIGRFLAEDGRINAFPSKTKSKILVLAYLATKFEPGKQYSEKEVNAIIERWHAFGDYFMLRRELCDRKFLARERDGSRYWLCETQPDLRAFGIGMK